jgi:hypothetical protein
VSDFATSLSAGDAALAPALAAVDRVSTGGDAFDPAALLRAAALLHALGEAGAARALSLYGEQADLGPGRAGTPLDGQRAILVARLLYVPRVGATPQLPPSLGKPDIGVNADPTLSPHWPLVVSCDVPFLPVGGYAVGGAPTSAARYVEQARHLGRLRHQPLTPSCSPVEAADRLVASAGWRAAVPEHQEAYARSLIYRQALRAGRPAFPADDRPIANLATISAADLDPTWQRLTEAPAARALSWDGGCFAVPGPDAATPAP